MKITFEDKSYLEIRKADKPDHVILIISAKDQENSRKKITNAVEITIEEFRKLLSDIV